MLDEPYFGAPATDLPPASLHFPTGSIEIARLRSQLSDEAEELLGEASQDHSGTVLKVHFIGGFYVQTNGKKFGDAKDPRSRAAWEGAVAQLCNLGLLQERGYKGEVFAVTDSGYRLADIIRIDSSRDEAHSQ